MKIKSKTEEVEETPVKKGKQKALKNKKQKPLKNTKKNKKAEKSVSGRKSIIGVPTSKRENLTEKRIIRKHDFLTLTTPVETKIYSLERLDEKSNKFQVSQEPHHVSAIMKLVLTVMQTNELSRDWTIALWNISQQDDSMLPDGASVVFSRTFERLDNEFLKKTIGRRRKLSVLSSDSEDNIKRQSVAVRHDIDLNNAIDSGDSVLSFGAEAIVTAKNEQDLEVAVEAVKNYLKANDETRGLTYELDVNKQNRPHVIYGPNQAAGNKDISYQMTSFDAAASALFVDSGGDRTPGSEYIGMSYGKMIRSHAAYNFQADQSLFVGNDTTGKTYTMLSEDNGGVIDEPSQIYLSKVASRSYLLSGHTVAHFVADDPKSVDQLMGMPINADRKCVVDVSKGLLNMMEAIDNGEIKDHPERIPGRFSTHINNIIVLLSQFRDTERMTVSDDFANIARDILYQFFTANKYWSDDANEHPENTRLLGVRHDQFKTLSDFGQYIEQRRRSEQDKSKLDALAELDTIVNRTILTTVRALNAHTDESIDDLVRAQYRVVDLTGLNIGAVGTVGNPSLNVMMISYMNLILPSLKSGDVIMIHGVSRMSKIANVIKEMITNSGTSINVIYTEKNQNAAISMLGATSEKVEEEDETTHRLKTVTRDTPLDFIVVDLYNNHTDKLYDKFGMDKAQVRMMGQNRASFFIRTETGVDYIYLDKIL